MTFRLLALCAQPAPDTPLARLAELVRRPVGAAPTPAQFAAALEEDRGTPLTAWASKWLLLRAALDRAVRDNAELPAELLQLRAIVALAPIIPTSREQVCGLLTAVAPYSASDIAASAWTPQLECVAYPVRVGGVSAVETTLAVLVAK